MHLLTREAMATYVRHLKPGGVMVFQATNRFVDIAGIDHGLVALNVYDEGIGRKFMSRFGQAIGATRMVVAGHDRGPAEPSDGVGD